MGKAVDNTKGEPDKTAAVKTTEVAVLKNQISMFTEQETALTTKKNRQPGNVVYYWYRQPGHL